MFKFLAIYRNESNKLKLYGWKIYDTIDEVEEIKEYYSKRKIIDFYIGEGIMVKYEDYEELMMDLEFLPITEERSNALVSMFGSETFGDFPI